MTEDLKKTTTSIDELNKEIANRKQAEKELREALDFNAKIISESPVGISIYTPSGQCVAANDSIAKIIGTTKEQVLQQNYNHIESWKKSGLLDKVKMAIT